MNPVVLSEDVQYRFKQLRLLLRIFELDFERLDALLRGGGLGWPSIG